MVKNDAISGVEILKTEQPWPAMEYECRRRGGHLLSSTITNYGKKGSFYIKHWLKKQGVNKAPWIGIHNTDGGARYVPVYRV
jgi:hypothetical protein